MRILLDTNALLWQLGLAKPDKLGVQAKNYMEKAEAVFASAVSLVEIQIKTMIGKLDAPADTQTMITDAGNTLLDFSTISADALRDFPMLARHDPFDRMLLAQASQEGLTFMTADTMLLQLDLPYVIDARL